MSTQVTNYYQIVSQLPEDASISFQDVSWSDYEEGNRINLDFEIDPPPDIVVEIDVHHDSRSRFPVYAALGVPEIWRYDGREMTIYHLSQTEDESSYVRGPSSAALPILTATLLTESIDRMRSEGELSALLAFDQWLQTRQ